MKRRLYIFLGLGGLVAVPSYFWTIAYMKAHSVPYDEQALYPSTITRAGETDAYWAELTPAFRVGHPDTSEHPRQSELLLTENGVLMGPAHSGHQDIDNLGKGRYSHWFSGRVIVMFSASDNSDPRTNGRIYRITDPSH
jgi:hypothetical protein